MSDTSIILIVALVIAIVAYFVAKNKLTTNEITLIAVISTAILYIIRKQIETFTHTQNRMNSKQFVQNQQRQMNNNGIIDPLFKNGRDKNRNNIIDPLFKNI